MKTTPNMQRIIDEFVGTFSTEELKERARSLLNEMAAVCDTEVEFEMSVMRSILGAMSRESTLSPVA